MVKFMPVEQVRQWARAKVCTLIKIIIANAELCLEIEGKMVLLVKRFTCDLILM